jgi:hypothetical protein
LFVKVKFVRDSLYTFQLKNCLFIHLLSKHNSKSIKHYAY